MKDKKIIKMLNKIENNKKIVIDKSPAKVNVNLRMVHMGPEKTWKVLAPVVQRLDNVIHWINHYPADSVICFVNT